MAKMGRFSFVLCMAVFSFFCSSSAFANFEKTKIAVLDFELHGNQFTTAEMGSIVSEWFVTSLVKDGRFDVVERAMLAKIVEEQKLGMTGVVDAESASKIGKILGVKVIISGSLLKLRDTININSRIISVESGSIISAESIKCGYGADLQQQVALLTDRIVKNFPLTGYIVKRSDQSVFIDLGRSAGLKKGMNFLVFKEGKVIKHPKTGEVLDVEQIKIGTIEITSIDRAMSEGIIVEENDPGIEYGQHVKSIRIAKAEKKAKDLGNGWFMTAKDAAELPEGMGAITVDPGEEGVKIQILNIGPKYRDGIQLQPGPYHIKVSKYGRQSNAVWVDVVASKSVELQTQMVVAAPSPSGQQSVSFAQQSRATVSGVDPVLVQNLQSRNTKTVIRAAKTIIRQGNSAGSPAFDLVEKRLLQDYKKDSGRHHTDAMAWLIKALEASHDEKYKKTLETVASEASSFKLKIYANKSLFTL